VNRLQTVEGAAVWDLLKRMTGQMRHMGQGHVTGWEMATAFTLADALGVDRFALAELYPMAEAAMVRKVNEMITSGGGGQTLLGDAAHG
jgi:high-affinity K+ transport system ATPase subunit B